MRVLVTGGAGFVGSVCVERLLAEGHRVAVIDNLSTGHRNAVPPEVEFIEGDLADAELVTPLTESFRPDVVMHFAGETLVGNSMTQPRIYFENNVQKAISFLNTLLDSGVKNFIFSSTAAVYGNPIETPLTEDHPTQPINAYGESKLTFEKVLEWYRRAYRLNYVAFRYFNACGATRFLGECHDPETHLIPRILNSLEEPGAEFVIYGDDYPTQDGTCVRDYVHVVDIARAHMLGMLALAGGCCGIYNIGSGSGYSVKEVMSVVQQVTGRPVPYRVGPPREGDPATLVASSSKLSNELHWQPRHSSLQHIVESAWEWKRNRPRGYEQSTGSGPLLVDHDTCARNCS